MVVVVARWRCVCGLIVVFLVVVWCGVVVMTHTYKHKKTHIHKHKKTHTQTHQDGEEGWFDEAGKPLNVAIGINL